VHRRVMPSWLLRLDPFVRHMRLRHVLALGDRLLHMPRRLLLPQRFELRERLRNRVLLQRWRVRVHAAGVPGWAVRLHFVLLLVSLGQIQSW
jgi:hypothetical protein